VPVERVDAVVGADRLGLGLAEELERLRPFGHGNAKPTLLVPAARVGDVRSMGEDGQHARFTIAGGGASARTVAFRTAAGSLPGSPEDRHDAAVRLELNEWNGTVEPRLVLRALCPSEPGECRPVVAERPFMDAFERALDADPAPASPPGGPAVRRVSDRRGEGFAGVAGDLLSSGEAVAIVCADVSRRRAGLDEVLGGIAQAARADDGAECRPALVSWEELRADPGVARPFRHLLALDPPLAAAAVQVAERTPCAAAPGTVQLAWGPAEIEFALAVARRDLDLRPAAIAIFRALRASSPCGGPALERALRGDGPRARPPALCARAVRVLSELGVVASERSERGIELRVLDAGPTEIDRSPTYRGCAALLGEATSRLGPAPARAA